MMLKNKNKFKRLCFRKKIKSNREKNKNKFITIKNPSIVINCMRQL